MSVESYKDLKVWQKSIDLVDGIYEVTKKFPKEEIYGLTGQLKRAAISLPSNIAEGSSKRSTKEFMRFINIAYGSLAELETQLIIAERQRFISKEQNLELSAKISEIGKMLNGLHRSLSEKISSEKITELRTLNSGNS